MEEAIKIIEKMMFDICESEERIKFHWDTEYWAYYALKDARDKLFSSLS